MRVVYDACVFMHADVDECEMEDGLCDDDQECVNSDGGFFCSCFNGYRMVDGVCEGKDMHAWSLNIPGP